MATRRPASSRARLNYNASNMPPPQTQPSRSRSVMTKSASSSKSTEEEQHTAPTIATTSKHSEDSEMNIRVVLRCRRRSEREINENSPIIVSSSGAKSKELSIEASTPVSSLGVVTLPPVRTYPFDLVFGPEADQAMVYHEVVHPMLEEVLMGYNCTLFAYGQTGTGKTHTMQGDLQPTPMGNPSSNAGMIPRVLFRLFLHLESLNADYSVKISFIELYNEELRDLLASELSAPAGSTQPMGMTNKDNSKAPDGGLKIFDDAGKRGVIIQGLEEVAVKDCKDSLALLTKGSLRRQIASTKFNDHSSRSHSVFSITVHIKETSSLGDDLLKIGKLNLVDLAGSENIGRSGAENKRAREAGMINQSLLTLGRVINALVDKAQHVPYRESKLTRLLQDSLGGRTKTCIIATISPARSNMEETLSTLDYAMRAKSIRNKPELNQRMTRNSLLKEYVAEIDRLKADLLAAREKNGIFFSEETWNQLSAEQELRQTEINEAKKQIEIVENQMRSVREEFEQSIALLMKTDGELRHAKEKLKLTESTLEEKEENLKLTQIALHEEEIIKEAHHKSELTLDGIAAGLKGVTSETLQDIERLFEKLDRVTKLLVSNNHVVVENEKTVSTASNTLSHSLMDYCQQFTQSLAFLRSETKQFEGKEQDFLAECSKRIDQQISQVDILLVQCQSSDRSEAKILERINNLTKELETVLLKDTTIWGDEMKKTFVQIHRKVEETCRVQFTTLEKALESFYEIAQGVIRGTQSYIEKERVSVQEVQSLTEKAAAKEILHLKQQNQALLQLLTDERTTAAKAKEDVVQRVSVLLGEYVKERDSHLKQAIGNIQQQNEEAQESMNAFSDKHAEVVLGMGKAATTFGLSMQKGAEDTKRTRDAASKALIPAKEVLTGGFTEVQSKFTSSFERYSTRIHSQFQAARTSYDEALEGHSRAKRARIEATTSYSANVRPELQLAKRELALTSENLGNYVSKTVSTVTSLENSTKGYSEASLRQLSRIQQATEALSDEGAKEIIPSGRTPRKRKWRYVDQWSLTGSRDEVLKAWKAEQPIMSSNSEPPRNSIPELEYQDMDGDSSLSSLSSVSVHNSITSDETPPIPVIPIPDIDTVGQKPLKEKSRLPVIGTLVDSRRRNVYDTRRPR